MSQKHKEEIIDSEHTHFEYKRGEWIAEFVEEELRAFVKRIRRRAKREKNIKRT